MIACLTLAVCIAMAARQYGLDPELLAAVIAAESGGNAHAVSPTGAQGLMQLEPATAASLGVSNAFDISENIRGGARYLAEQQRRFGSLPIGLASYNAGPSAVIKAGGIPNNGETPRYVSTVISNQVRFQQARAEVLQAHPVLPRLHPVLPRSAAPVPSWHGSFGDPK